MQRASVVVSTLRSCHTLIGCPFETNQVDDIQVVQPFFKWRFDQKGSQSIKAIHTNLEIDQKVPEKQREQKMCFRVECKQCGKYSWGGCGKHLKTLYGSIDKGKHCMCRSWPGVVIPQEEAATEKQSVASASGNPVINSLEDQIGNCIRLIGTKSRLYVG